MKLGSLFKTCIFFVVTNLSVTAHAKNFTVQKLSNQAYVLTKHWSDTSKANMGVVVGDDGILLINTMMQDDVESLENTLRTISPLPVKYVINSNWDTYNHQANAHFAKKGATIIGQKNLQYRPVYTQLLFDDELRLTIGKEEVIAYTSDAHSFAHINVQLKTANVIFMADSFRNDWMTVTGPNGITGHIAGIGSVLARANEKTVIVPGNTLDKTTSNLSDLENEKKIRIDFLAKVNRLHHSGFSPEQIANDAEILAFFKKHYPKRSFSPKSKVIQVLQSDVISEMTLSESQLDNYIGVYQHSNKQQLEILRDDTGLIARSEGQFIERLIPQSPTEFAFITSTKSDKFIFEMNSEGSVIGLKPDVAKSYFRFFIENGEWRKVTR